MSVARAHQVLAGAESVMADGFPRLQVPRPVARVQ
jgi:hypothetical protein